MSTLRHRGRGQQQHPAPAGPKVHTVTERDSDPLLWAPERKTALFALFLLRMLGAMLLPISDCDETFNYWEPMHWMMYGYGFQTWEYSPQFALRSYGYVGLHAAVGHVARLLEPRSKVRSPSRAGAR